MSYRKKPEKKWLIYCVTNTVNGKKYVGLTCASLKERWSAHLTAARRKISNSYLHKAIRHYGARSFTIETIYEATSLREANIVEKGVIAERGTFSPVGYNLTCGGDGTEGIRGIVRSEETRRCQSIAALGKKKSPEHCAALSAAKKGKPLPKWHADIIRIAGRKNKGKKHSERQTLVHRIAARERTINKGVGGKFGLTGVSQHKYGVGFMAQLYIDKKRKRLGTFRTPELAREAFLAAAITDLANLKAQLALLPD